jgi:hypothetical protein
MSKVKLFIKSFTEKKEGQWFESPIDDFKIAEVVKAPFRELLLLFFAKDFETVRGILQDALAEIV